MGGASSKVSLFCCLDGVLRYLKGRTIKDKPKSGETPLDRSFQGGTESKVRIENILTG